MKSVSDESNFTLFKQTLLVWTFNSINKPKGIKYIHAYENIAIIFIDEQAI